MNVAEVMSNPVRTKIVQFLQINGESTTKTISDALPEISAPTLYRHVNALLKENVLIVTDEKKIRGTTERILSLNPDLWNVSDGIDGYAYQFLMSLYGSFREYASSEDQDPARDRLCLRTCVLNLTDEEFDCFASEYGALIEKYGSKGKSGKARSVSFVSAPVTDSE